MIQRLLYSNAFSDEWGRQMRFITGPRQTGKTTLAKQKLTREKCGELYYLWDLRKVRNRYRENELFFTADAPPRKKMKWLCFNEIHKMPKWKNILKGIYDETFEHYHFIVTGSAKLDVLKRAGDSLSGRYFTFHLYPLCLQEACANAPKTPPDIPAIANDYILTKMDGTSALPGAVDTLMDFGGFPEPFLKQSVGFLRKWSEEYAATIIKEDIGALTRIIDREYLYELYNLLPQMVGSPISESSLAGHLQISPVTVKNYLKRLEDFYLMFSLRPYSKNIKRSLLRASKCYLFDWTKIQDPGARFEDFTACQLKTETSLWADGSGVNYDMHYIRNKQKQETDFLITREKKPWLLIEAKLKDGPVDKHHYSTAADLKVPFVQVCKERNVASLQKKGVYRISADRFFG